MKRLHTTQLGISVWLNPRKFHVHLDITEDIIKEILCKSELPIDNYSRKQQSESLNIEFDFGYNIGYTFCVKTTPNDIIYFKRRNRKCIQSRMVSGRVPEKSQSITLVLVRKDKYTNDLLLLTAYIGKEAKPEIGDLGRHESSDNYLNSVISSGVFWSQYALIDEYPTAEQLYKDCNLIWKREYRDNSTYELFPNISPVLLGEIVSKRMGYRRGIRINSDALCSKESLIIWLSNNIIFDSNKSMND